MLLINTFISVLHFIGAHRKLDDLFDASALELKGRKGTKRRALVDVERAKVRVRASA